MHIRHDEKIPPATLKKADTATTLNEDVEPLEDSHLLPLNSFPSSHHRSVGNSKMNPSSNGAKSVQMALEKAQQNEQIKHLEEEVFCVAWSEFKHLNQSKPARFTQRKV